MTDLDRYLDSLPQYGPDAFPAGVVYAYRPNLNRSARRARANAMLRAYRRALLARDIEHDLTAGWSARARDLARLDRYPVPTETHAGRVRSIRQRSYRNMTDRRARALAAPGNIGAEAADRKARLAYRVQAIRYQMVRMLARA
jgi:hypothetical protein